MKNRKNSLTVGQDKISEMLFFDEVCKGGQPYDHNEYVIINHQRISELLRTDSVGQNRKVLLDAGCGSGAYGIRLANEGYTVVEIDISLGMVRSAQRWSKEKKTDFSVILGDLEICPLGSESFDCCVYGFIMHHFRNLDLIMKEVSRIIKPKGKIMLVEPSGSNPAIWFGGALRSLLPHKIIVKKRLATANETFHNIKSYMFLLKTFGFGDIKVLAVHYRSPPTSYKSMLHFMEIMRGLFFNMCRRILPPLFGSSHVVITAIKQ